MDRFTQFAAPAQQPSKRGLFARLFGFGGSSADEEETQPKAPAQTSSGPSKAPAASQSLPPTPTTQTKVTTPVLSHSTQATPQLNPAGSKIQSLPAPDRSPTKSAPKPSINNNMGATFIGSPPPDRPEAAMKKIKQRQLDHRSAKAAAQFAMDDTKATMCYECETPFGMLVRRQHCRTCGQIFCSKCTRKTSQGEIPGYDGSIRVCHFCYNILQNPNLAADINKIIDTASTAAEASRSANRDVGNLGDSDDDDDDADAAEEKLLSNNYQQVSFTPRPMTTPNKRKSRRTASQDLDSKSENSTSSVGTPTSNASSIDDVASSWHDIDETEEAEDTAETSGAENQNESAAVPQDGKGEPPKPDNEEDPSSSSTRPEKDAISRFRMQSQIRRQASMQTFAVPPSTPEKVSKPPKDDSVTLASDQATAAAGQSPKTEPSAQVANEALNKEARAHLEKMCEYLSTQYGLNACWRPIILSLARAACENLRPQWRLGDRIDVRNYVKIKKIPGGSMEECAYVDGLVFTKNRSHKSMRTDIQSARVLLLGCSIEFERKTERIMSFDKLLSQERDYLRMLVSKIASMQPDVILVEKSVSRIAQDLIRDTGICLALNVKPHVLQQVSRITQTTILQSTEHVLTANPGVIGHFKIESFSGPWGTKPIMYIAGCPRHLFSSVILRGAPEPVLARVKSVLSFMISANWNVKLENSLLQDEFATVKPIEPLPGPMSTSWSVAVPVENHKKKREVKHARKPSLSHSDELGASNVEQDNSSTSLASELSQYLVGPTLLRTPMLPELSLSSTAAARDDDRSAHLALNFSYRSLLSPNPIRPDERSTQSTPSPLASDDSSRKLASKFSFGDSAQTVKHEQLVDQHFMYLHSLFSNVTSTQCTPFEWQIIHFYSQNDLTLGQFLETFCFSSRMKCSTPECHKPLIDHERCFMHHDGRINVAVRPWPSNLPNPVTPHAGDSKSIYTWAYCRKQSRQTPYMVPMSQEALSFSFGKYLELYFYAARTQCRACGQSLYKEHIRYFYYDNRVAIFAFEPVKAMEVVVPPMRMRFDDKDSVALLDQELEDIIYLSQRIHERVMSKLTELEDSYLPSDAEERAEIQNFRKTQEKEKISFLEKLQREQEKINANQTNMFQLATLRRYLYGNVKTWNSMITEHEIRYQKKRQSVSVRKDNHAASAAAPIVTVQDASASIGSVSATAPTTTLAAPTHRRTLSSSGDSVPSTPVIQQSTGSLDNASNIVPSTEAPNSDPALPAVEPAAVDAVSPDINFRKSTEVPPMDPTQASPVLGTAVPHNQPPPSLGKDKRAATFLDAFSAFSEILPTKTKSAITDVMEDSKVHIFSSGSASHACTAIYENEPSSIIAFALNSEEYEAELKKFQPPKPAATFMEEAFRAITSPNNTTIANEWRTSSVWGGPRIRISCTSHFAHQFTWLRRLIGLSEERFTLSLSRCRSWLAQGGKSGSRFCKTMDGRFILKSIQPVELQGFLAFAPLYFDYFSKVFFQQVPTAIAKTVGIYTVYIKTGKKEEKLDFVIMENLFYGHNIEKTFDLKGSLRSRYATAKAGGPRDVVFMDENLLELMYTDPICVSNEAKALLGMTVWNDTLCLASLNVMDYSLVVGVDEEKNQLVIGIIDYMRTYTWDKQLETWVKQTMGNTKKPTIISPKLYKKRFRNAIWNYFILLPSAATSVQSGYHPALR